VSGAVSGLPVSLEAAQVFLDEIEYVTARLEDGRVVLTFPQGSQLVCVSDGRLLFELKKTEK
jgi:hypothetical protein